MANKPSLASASDVELERPRRPRPVEAEPAPAPPSQIELDRAAELQRQADIAAAVDAWNATQRAEAAKAAGRAELGGRPVIERDARARRTDAVTVVRQAAPDSREITGIAVPYGQVAMSTELGAEAFAPGAFGESVAQWTSRTDGARMPFRPRHGQPAIGSVTQIRDAAEGVEFTARIRPGARGDEYLADVADGINGVSIEFQEPPNSLPRRGRDGTTVHRSARLMAIAGSDVPAYDGARVSLRDMEDPAMRCKHCDAELAYGVGHDCPKDPAKQGEPHDDTGASSAQGDGATTERDGDVAIVHLDARTRSALEVAGVRGLGSSIRTTRPEAVYGPSKTDLFFRDNFAATQGDWEAAQRQQRHYGLLHEYAKVLEREAVWRMLNGLPTQQRAGDVLSSEIPGAYPNDYLPGLLTPRILKGRPMADFYQRVPIADARPRIFPKVTTSSSVAVQSAEGAALSATDFATTAVTATPLMYGGYTDVSRQVLDGADPAAEAMLMQDLAEAYSQTAEGVVKTAVEAGASAGVAITAATPYAGAIANVVNYYTTRFRTAKRAFIPPAAFSTLLAQLDTTGRPLVPQIGPVNSDGSVSTDGDQIVAALLSAQGTLAWQGTLNTWVFGVQSDYVIYESAVAQFRYDQVVGPQAVRVGLWAYLVVGTRLGSLKVVAA